MLFKSNDVLHLASLHLNLKMKADLSCVISHASVQNQILRQPRHPLAA